MSGALDESLVKARVHQQQEEREAQPAEARRPGQPRSPRFGALAFVGVAVALAFVGGMLATVFYDRLVAPPEPMAPLDLKDPPPAPPAPPTVPELTPEQRRALDVEKALADLRAQLPPAAVVEVKVRVDGGAVFLEGKVDTRGTLDQAARVTGGVAGVVAVDTRGLSIESRLHAVAQGETLSDIAKHYYGKSDAWPRIVKANPGLAPERMHAGQELRIPSSDE